jgi:transposase
MSKTPLSITPTTALNYETTLVIVVETSKTLWVVGAQVLGFPQTKAKQKIKANASALEAVIDGYKRRAASVGKTVERVVVVYEAGYGGFWLARWLQQRSFEVYVIHPASVPVERKSRRAKSEAIDVDLLLRTVLAAGGTAGVFHGADPRRARRGRATAGAGTGRSDCRADRADQPDWRDPTDLGH